MDIQHKTNEQLKQELLELRQEYDSLKGLYENERTMSKNSYDALLETNHKLTLAMRGGNMAWWEMDVPSGKVTFDKHKVEMLGYLPENFSHYKDFTALVHPKDYKGIMNAMNGHLNGTLDKYEAEYRIMSSSGEYIWFYDFGSVIKRDSNGTPLICTGFVYTITERKNAEKSLLEIMKALDSTSDAIGISDSKGRHFYQNKALSDLFEYKTAEETEAAGGGMARVKDPVIAKQMFSNILQGKSWSGELDMVTKSGRVFPAYERADAIIDREGNIIGVIGVITDITERRQAEEILLKSENMLQAVLDNFPGVVFWKDRQSNYLGCNLSFASGAGLKNPAEIVGKTDHEMPWASTEAMNYLNDDRAVMESGKGRLHIIETQHQSDGQVIWLNTSKLPLRDSTGQVIGVIGISNDISTLKMAEQELINTNKELVLQNEVKQKQALELVHARDKAEASDRLKTAFMNNISHEIRTPLNAILGFAPFVIEPDITIQKKEEYVEILNFSSKRLMNTITDMMDISLIVSGNMEAHPHPIEITSLLTNVIEYFQEPCKKKNLELKMQFPDTADQIILIADREMLLKTVSKLVDNSIKFTEEGEVTLGFEITNDQIEIFVKDTGKGIEKDVQELIFKHFFQEDTSVTRGYEGNGLGLSIAKGLIQLLGGEIRLESTKNVGTTVFLTLPYSTSAAFSKTKDLTNAIRVKGMPVILIAEDNESSYSFFETVLRKGSKTLRACNGQEAVDLCRKHPEINLVLMDIKMPVMNGIEATHIIKSFRNDLPIIAVTAFAQSGDEFKIKEAGCDDYLSKPISKTELLSLIQKYFKKQV